MAPFEKLRKVPEITWTPELEAAWLRFRKIIQTPPVLHQPRPDLQFCVATDASIKGVGAVLYQVESAPPPGSEEKRRYVMFAAKSLNSAQRNYPTPKRELLGIIFALKVFHEYLAGMRFTLYTDHSALTSLLSQRQNAQTLAYWTDVILQYDMTVVHRPGVANILPDALSRLFPKAQPS